ncbi:MAG: MBL fold metallo-hydrolase [Candidatus Omnitrophota bacterium]
MKQTINDIRFEPVGEGIYLIETYYIGKAGFACCYVIVENNEVAIIETNTNHALPYILGTLNQLGIHSHQVKYVMLTHIHLDHAGGTGELMNHLPEAKLVVHPRGKKHMIDPEKLIESVKQVYGEDAYKDLYGEIVPVAKERVITPGDGDTIRLSDRELVILDTPGHAKHHLVIFDPKTASLFSGDNFGIAYPRFTHGNTRLVFPSTSPTQFEPDRALETYRRIIDLNPSQILLTHYGPLTHIHKAHDQLKAWIDFSVQMGQKYSAEGLRNHTLTLKLEDELWNRLDATMTQMRGLPLTAEEREWLKIDTELNAQGIAYYFDKPGNETNNK